jgi:hypothetical protein
MEASDGVVADAANDLPAELRDHVAGGENHEPYVG